MITDFMYLEEIKSHILNFFWSDSFVLLQWYRNIVQKTNNILEAFPVDNSRARFVIFLFGDPHLLESRQRCQDGATDPY